MIPQGVGVGLRIPHLDRVLAERPDVPWFEVLIDDFLGTEGPLLRKLEAVRQRVLPRSTGAALRMPPAVPRIVGSSVKRIAGMPSGSVPNSSRTLPGR